MKITHSMNWMELGSVGTDKNLVPVLRQKGMAVYYTYQIEPVYGTFTWTDMPWGRTFIWEGEHPPPPKLVPPESERKPKPKLIDEDTPIRDITIEEP